MTQDSWKGPELAQRIERVLARFARDPGSHPGPANPVEALQRWAELVIEWNQRMDLTAARSPDELVDLLLADAAQLSKLTPDGPATWVDVGSGAGAPGLAIALLRPDLKVTLVEPKQKRVVFLRSVLHELERADIFVERARADALASKHFDVAVSRATLAPPEWVREGARLARRTVWVLLAQAEPPAAPSGFRKEIDERYTLPLGGAERRAVSYVRSTAREKSQPS
jgi:16S rRNA (guanine527-N7)-methyltransferase